MARSNTDNLKTGLIVAGTLVGGFVIYKIVTKPADTGLPIVRSLGVPADTGAPPPYSDPRRDQVFPVRGDGSTAIPDDTTLRDWLATHELDRRVYAMQVALYRLGYTNQRATSIWTQEDNNARTRFATTNRISPTLGLLNPTFIAEVKRIWRKQTELNTGIRPYPWPLATAETIETMPLVPATQT